MKNVLKGLVLAGTLASGAAHADDASALEQFVNCDSLTHSPYICVFNETKSPIVGIGCVKSGFFSDSEVGVPVPRGVIPAGKVSVVKFPEGLACEKKLTVTTRDGHRHDFVGQNVSDATVLTITSDGGW